MRRLLSILIAIAVALSLGAVAAAVPPEGKPAKPPKDKPDREVVISMGDIGFGYEPAYGACVSDVPVSWSPKVAEATLEFEAWYGEDLIGDQEVEIPKGPYSSALVGYAVPESTADNEYTIDHKFSLYDKKGKLVATFDDDPDTALYCVDRVEDPDT